MTREQIELNVEYLQKNHVTVDVVEYANGVIEYELYFRTPADGDFGIQVDELSKNETINVLEKYDVNEEALLWWNGGRSPFSNIKALYNDIEKWRRNFLNIVKKMPY